MRDAASARRPLVAYRRFGLAALALALPLAACGGAQLDIYDLKAATPAPARPLSARVRVADPIGSCPVESNEPLYGLKSFHVWLFLGPGSDMHRQRLIEPPMQKAGVPLGTCMGHLRSPP